MQTASVHCASCCGRARALLWCPVLSPGARCVRSAVLPGLYMVSSAPICLVKQGEKL